MDKFSELREKVLEDIEKIARMYESIGANGAFVGMHIDPHRTPHLLLSVNNEDEFYQLIGRIDSLGLRGERHDHSGLRVQYYEGPTTVSVTYDDSLSLRKQGC